MNEPGEPKPKSIGELFQEGREQAKSNMLETLESTGEEALSGELIGFVMGVLKSNGDVELRIRGIRTTEAMGVLQTCSMMAVQSIGIGKPK